MGIFESWACFKGGETACEEAGLLVRSFDFGDPIRPGGGGGGVDRLPTLSSLRRVSGGDRAREDAGLFA